MKRQNSRSRKDLKKVSNNISFKKAKINIESRSVKKRKSRQSTSISQKRKVNLYNHITTNKQTRRSLYYYQKQWKSSIEKVVSAKSLTREQVVHITKTISEITQLFTHLSKTSVITEQTRDDIRENLSEINLFLKRMNDPDVAFSVGRYIRKYGFHEIFLPRKEFEDGSISLKEAISRLNQLSEKEIAKYKRNHKINKEQKNQIKEQLKENKKKKK